MTNPVILLRKSDIVSDEEIRAMSDNFEVIESRMDIKPNSLVIGRYSVLPFYEEQERDILKANSKLINSYKQHRYVAYMNWYEDLNEFTPKTWRRLEDIDEDGPYVLKGATNSRKFQWDTHMFAKNKQQAAEIYCELANDSLICSQDIYIRKYVPLKTYMRAIHDLPITKEFRIFVYDQYILSMGYYWSSHVEDLIEVPSYLETPKDFLYSIVDRISNKCMFYAMDVAQTENGDWILVELNDGQMSGLSENNPEVLYRNLRAIL